MRMRIALVMGILAASVSAAASAQQPASPAAAAQQGFAEVSAWVTKAADLVPAEKYAYRPVETVRTFGQQIAHIADSYVYFCARATGKPVEWSDAIEKGATGKAALTGRLEAATAACTAAYAAAGDQNAGPLTANIGHTNLHYGNIVTYMRMMGLTPPSS